MIEVRVFATLREGRDKIIMMDPADVQCASDIIKKLSIPPEEVSILLINGFHQKPDASVKDGDVVALFPPVGGG